MSSALWTPGAVDTQKLSAADREAARVALNEHVEMLTQKHNALVAGVRQIAETSEATAVETGSQIAAILDRLTALDSHEDRIDGLERAASVAKTRTVWQRLRAVFRGVWNGTGF